MTASRTGAILTRPIRSASWPACSTAYASSTSRPGIAGPVAGMLLADHGADVIKVEPPGGDPYRGNPGYDVWLRGRRSIELDLHAAADRECFLALVDSADVVLESFSPGTTARLGIDAETLLRTQPAPDLLLDHRLRTARRAPRPPRLRRPRGGPARHPARAARPPRRRASPHARRAAVSGGPGDPGRDGARLAAHRPDLHVHARGSACRQPSWRPRASAPRCTPGC